MTANGSEETTWLTVAEVAQRCGVARQSVYRWIETGALPYRIAPVTPYRTRILVDAREIETMTITRPREMLRRLFGKSAIKE